MSIRKIQSGDSTEQLKIQVCELLKNSPYAIESLTIDDRHFGNVYLELRDSFQTFRFIQDRGDIYVEKKLVDTTQWIECLFLSHEEADEQYYGLLLKAVTLIATT